MIRALAAVIAILVALLVTQSLRLANVRTELAEARQEHAETLRDLADKTAAVASAVRARESIYHADSARAADTYEKDKAHALATKDGVIRDLRLGNLRLRELWKAAGSATCPGDAADAAAAGGDVDQTRLREESAGRIIGNGAAADAWIIWLQSELIATRALLAAPK